MTRSIGKPIFVIAGSPGEARFWARERNLRPDEFCYIAIGRANDLIGYKNPEVVWIGNYGSRGDCEEIRALLQRIAMGDAR